MANFTLALPTTVGALNNYLLMGMSNSGSPTAVQDVASAFSTVVGAQIASSSSSSMSLARKKRAANPSSSSEFHHINSN